MHNTDSSTFIVGFLRFQRIGDDLHGRVSSLRSEGRVGYAVHGRHHYVIQRFDLRRTEESQLICDLKTIISDWLGFSTST